MAHKLTIAIDSSQLEEGHQRLPSQEQGQKQGQQQRQEQEQEQEQEQQSTANTGLDDFDGYYPEFLFQHDLNH
jgi:hypothetical protein